MKYHRRNKQARDRGREKKGRGTVETEVGPKTETNDTGTEKVI
jgi:hypothetical protein